MLCGDIEGMPSVGDQLHGCDDEKYTFELHFRSFKSGECPMMMAAVSPRSVGAMLHRMREKRASVHHIHAVQIMAQRLPPQVLLAMECLRSQV